MVWWNCSPITQKEKLSHFPTNSLVYFELGLMRTHELIWQEFWLCEIISLESAWKKILAYSNFVIAKNSWNWNKYITSFYFVYLYTGEKICEIQFDEIIFLFSYLHTYPPSFGTDSTTNLKIIVRSMTKKFSSRYILNCVFQLKSSRSFVWLFGQLNCNSLFDMSCENRVLPWNCAHSTFFCENCHLTPDRKRYESVDITGSLG